MKNILFFSVSILFTISCNDENKYKWLSVGDSITYQDGKEYEKGEEKGKICKGYQSIWIEAQDTIVKLDNKGYSGYSLAGKEKSVYDEIIDSDFSKYDLITIAVGTNDFKLNKPIYSNDSLNSFNYTYKSILDSIKSKNSKAKIYLLTPVQRNKDGYTSLTKNKAGLTLNDYRTHIITLSNEYDLELIDLYEDSGISESNLSKYTIDGLHPNNAGYKLIGKVLIDKIKI